MRIILLTASILQLFFSGNVVGQSANSNQSLNVQVESDRGLPEKFIGFVSGYFTNENQNTLDPKNFPFVIAEHCGVTVVNSETDSGQSAFLYQIGTGESRRRMVFIVRELTGESVELASRKIMDPAKYNSEICRKNSDNRVIDDADLKPATCRVFYQYDKQADVFRGSTAVEGCPSSFMGAVAMHVKEVVSDGRLEIEERWLNASGKQVAGSTAGPYIYVRKQQFSESQVAQYSCWASVRKPDGTHTWDRLNVSDRGGEFSTGSIVNPEGETLSYKVKLDRVSFENKVPVLKLAIYKSGSEKSTLYQWAEVGARRIGINLTWIQVGCTRTE